MAMFAERVDSETPELHEQGVRMRFIGRRDRVGDELLERMEWAEATTAANERITLFVAFDYGGRQEILDAAERYEGGGEEVFTKGLYAPEMHDPDLLIRTSGRAAHFQLPALAVRLFGDRVSRRTLARFQPRGVRGIARRSTRRASAVTASR